MERVPWKLEFYVTTQKNHFRKNYFLDIRRSSTEASDTDSNQYKKFFQVHIQLYEDPGGPDSLTIDIPIIQKPFNGIALEINYLVSAWQ